MAANNPYVGPASFRENDRGRFFGRDDEARELSYLLIARPAVLLYAQSGAGKTSLLQAKVVPDLRESGEMHVLPITRVSGPASDGNIYVANALTGLKLTGASLTDALAPLFTESRDREEPSPHLLIFDQFEEIFTFRAELADARRGFFEQLRGCLDAYPKLGLLLSMREDYLADIDSFAGYLPDRLRTRMRMERLSSAQAEEAIARPAADAGKPFDAGVARKLAGDLSRVQTSRKVSPNATDDGHALGKYVEPVQLQIVCRQLWSKLPEDAVTITAEHLDTLARVDDALTNFYRDSLAAVRERLPGLSERTLREWFGEYLITSAKTRGMVYQGETETEGLPNAAVEVLREKYILRADSRPSGTWYELAHDRLVEPILLDNLNWKAAYRNPVAEALRRDPDHLLSGSRLTEALQFARENGAELTVEERQFLQKSEREAQLAKARRRGRNLFLLLLAVGGVAWLKQDTLRERYVWYHEMQAPLFPGGDGKSVFRDCNKGCPTMVVLPSCKFTMGSNEAPTADAYSEPPHEVTIGKPFAVSMTQITFGEWNACVRGGGCEPILHPPLQGAALAAWGRDDQPVFEVGWPRAVGYTRWLSRLSGNSYRLLSEAEWEYAARAGGTTSYSFGDDASQLGQHAWFKDNSGGVVHPVGQKPANAFGLRDMPGDLKEWVEDPLHVDYRAAPDDGASWGTEGTDRDPWRRGGGFDSTADLLRSASRGAGTADGRGYEDVGFRVARMVEDGREAVGGCKGR